MIDLFLIALSVLSVSILFVTFIMLMVTSPCIMSVQKTEAVRCNGACSVHWGDIMSTAGGHYDKCGGRSLGK